jgi:hypothetical protein
MHNKNKKIYNYCLHTRWTLTTNGLMIVIANVDKTLNSPVFVIIQSLSATSIIRGIIFFLMKFVGCYILQFAYDMSRSQSTACHIQGLAEYVDNVILFQLWKTSTDINEMIAIDATLDCCCWEVTCRDTPFIVLRTREMIIEQTKRKTRNNAKHILYTTWGESI